MFRPPAPLSRFMTKRSKFIITSLLLALGLIGVQLTTIEFRYQAIAGLAVAAYLLASWSLRKDIAGIEWLTVPVLPMFYTAGVGLFYFLLPERWLSRLMVAVIYSLGFYALLLTENIYAIAALRSIQLLRAAQTVGFLLTLATSFFLFDTILSLRLPFWLNFILVFVVALPLFFQALWSVNLEEKFSWPILFSSLILSLVSAETALFLSFWPVTVIAGSLFLTTVVYVVLGLVQERLKERLFEKTLKEYLWVGLAVFGVTFLITHWG